jgi:hypothetical protein
VDGAYVEITPEGRKEGWGVTGRDVPSLYLGECLGHSLRTVLSPDAVNKISLGDQEVA